MQESSGLLAGLPANVPITFRFNQNVLGGFYLMSSVRRIQYIGFRPHQFGRPILAYHTLGMSRSGTVWQYSA